MKLILSRKGFDSSSGGVPSPVFPDGRMLSLPIPDKRSVVTYTDLSYDGDTLGPLVVQLTRGRIAAHYGAHIDPDLVTDRFPRQSGWRPIFGQTGPAQSHLRNAGVGAGDLFLFFGLFRLIEKRGGAYSWARGSRPFHAIWGWLQVDEALSVPNLSVDNYEWAAYHPHFRRDREPNNVIYLARRRLQIAGQQKTRLPGAGVFPKYSPTRELTAAHGENPSTWQLPAWFHPTPKRTPLTYHSDMARWHKQGAETVLRSVARGQEFVLDIEEYPEALGWACDLIRNNDGQA